MVKLGYKNTTFYPDRFAISFFALERPSNSENAVVPV